MIINMHYLIFNSLWPVPHMLVCIFDAHTQLVLEMHRSCSVYQVMRVENGNTQKLSPLRSPNEPETQSQSLTM